MITNDRPKIDSERRNVMCGIPDIWISIGNRDLLFHLLGGTAGPLGDDRHIVVGDIGIGFHRQVVKRDRTPAGQQDRMASTTNLLFSAKSTRARIISVLFS